MASSSLVGTIITVTEEFSELIMASLDRRPSFFTWSN